QVRNPKRRYGGEKASQTFPTSRRPSPQISSSAVGGSRCHLPIHPVCRPCAAITAAQLSASERSSTPARALAEVTVSGPPFYRGVWPEISIARCGLHTG